MKNETRKMQVGDLIDYGGWLYFYTPKGLEGRFFRRPMVEKYLILIPNDFAFDSNHGIRPKVLCLRTNEICWLVPEVFKPAWRLVQSSSS